MKPVVDLAALIAESERPDDKLDPMAFVREFSDPPLCRVCDEPLTFGSSSRDGMKWAHYIKFADGQLWDREAADHTDRSTHWNPKPRADIVAMARELMKARAALPALCRALREAMKVVEAARICAPAEAVAVLREVAKTSGDKELLEMLALGDAVSAFDRISEGSQSEKEEG